MSDSVQVSRLPKCDFCMADAVMDAKTTMGPWANMCEEHGEMYGAYYPNFGTGMGQRLTLEKVERSYDKVVLMAADALGCDPSEIDDFLG